MVCSLHEVGQGTVRVLRRAARIWNHAWYVQWKTRVVRLAGRWEN
jgi:hypothetical protein